MRSSPLAEQEKRKKKSERLPESTFSCAVSSRKKFEALERALAADEPLPNAPPQSKTASRSGTMEDGEGSAAAFEAALGLNPRYFIDDALDIVDDIGRDAFQYARQEAATAGVLSAAKAARKAAELDRGFNAICHVVLDVLEKRMTSWDRYCRRKIFTLPEGLALPEDDNSCAKESLRDGTSDPELDLDLLRKNLESANKESENLRREMSSLERQTTYKRELDSSIAEIQKLFEERSVQQNFEDLAKAIPILQQKIISLKKKKTEAGSLVDRMRDKKRLALDKDFTARTEDIQEVVNILQNK